MELNGRIRLDGQKIKELRALQYLSREMFSSKSQQMGCYLSISTLKRAESSNKIYFRTAQDIASILKVSLDDLQIKESSASEQSHNKNTLSRSEQLHRASTTLARVNNEKKGSVIYIQGEAGIGKSSFILNLTENAQNAGFLNFHLPIYDNVTNRKKILQDLIRQFIHHRLKTVTQYSRCHSHKSGSNNAECLKCFAQEENLSYEHKRALLTLFDESARSLKTINYHERKSYELELLFVLIRNTQSPICLILEDIHWASTDIITTIQSLTHEARNWPLVIILSSRLINNPIYEIWNNSVLNTPLELFNLSPLNDDELRSMIGADKKFPKKVYEKYIKLSNGNPLFFQSLIDMNTIYNESNIPQSLNSLIKQELNRLSKDGVTFLNSASILGHEFELEEVAEIFKIRGYTPQELVNCNFLHQVKGRHFIFNHDLIRQGIYQHITEELKKELHELASTFYKDKDQLKFTFHLRKAQQVEKALSAINDFAKNLYEKHDYCEALNQVDIALVLPGKKDLYSLYYLKGVLLKVLDLPAKATQYLEKALQESKNKQDKLEIRLELTEIYAVNQRLELSKKHLDAAKKLLTGNESTEVVNKIKKYQNYIKKCTFSLNNTHTKLQYQKSSVFKTSIQNLDSPHQPSTDCQLKKQHKIALLHSVTGPLKEHEEGVIKSCIMAFEEINENGGLLDHSIAYEIYDGQSDEHIFREQAEKIVNDHHITSIFGCSTSSTRKQVKTVVEKSNSLLVYPYHYEGLESSKNIIYTGPTSNLQALPIIDWFISHHNSETFYFIGSDYVYPYVTNEILKDAVNEYDGKIVGEDYRPIGSSDFEDIIEGIKQANPSVIILTLASIESNKAFLEKFHESGINKDGKIHLVSLVLSDRDINHIPITHCQGLYSIFSYFQNNDNYSNNDFIQKFKLKYGKNERIGGYMESAYVGVKLWAQAVQKCKTFTPEKITEAIKGLTYYGPGGIAYIDEENQHIWRHTHIAQVENDGEFHVRWSSEQPIAPSPYPLSRTESEWKSFLETSKTRWKGSWGI